MNEKEGSRQVSLSERIEKLVSAMERLERLAEKKFSLKYAFARGLVQGLGIVIGSTILAGVLYWSVTKFINPELIKSWTLEYMVEKK